MIQKDFIVAGKPVRLDNFLSEALGRRFSRAQVQRFIAEGNIKIEGKVMTDKSRKVHRGQKIRIVYSYPKLQAQPNIKLKKIYEDADVLILDKPAGLVVHPNPSQSKFSLVGGLLAEYPALAAVGDKFRPGIVHRLDADTSGLLVVAKNNASLEFLKRQFHDRKVIKIYTALVHGALAKPHGIFDQPIGRKPGQKKFSAGFGRDAKTEYWVERTLRKGLDFYTLVRIQLHTGRTHQIRVHFAAAGHPVVGDRLYGGPYAETDRVFAPRQFLHATSLKLQLFSGTAREFTSLLPQDLRQVLKILES